MANEVDPTLVDENIDSLVDQVDTVEDNEEDKNQQVVDEKPLDDISVIKDLGKHAMDVNLSGIASRWSYDPKNIEEFTPVDPKFQWFDDKGDFNLNKSGLNSWQKKAMKKANEPESLVDYFLSQPDIKQETPKKFTYNKFSGLVDNLQEGSLPRTDMENFKGEIPIAYVFRNGMSYSADEIIKERIGIDADGNITGDKFIENHGGGVRIPGTENTPGRTGIPASAAEYVRWYNSQTLSKDGINIRPMTPPEWESHVKRNSISDPIQEDPGRITLQHMEDVVLKPVVSNDRKIIEKLDILLFGDNSLEQRNKAEEILHAHEQGRDHNGDGIPDGYAISQVDPGSFPGWVGGGKIGEIKPGHELAMDENFYDKMLGGHMKRFLTETDKNSTHYLDRTTGVLPSAFDYSGTASEEIKKMNNIYSIPELRQKAINNLGMSILDSDLENTSKDELISRAYENGKKRLGKKYDKYFSLLDDYKKNPNNETKAELDLERDNLGLTEELYDYFTGKTWNIKDKEIPIELLSMGERSKEHSKKSRNHLDELLLNETYKLFGFAKEYVLPYIEEYGTESLFRGYKGTERIREGIGESQIKKDIKEIKEFVNKGDNLGLTLIAGNHPIAVEWNKMLRETQTLERAIVLNDDPVAGREGDMFGAFMSSARDIAGFQTDKAIGDQTSWERVNSFNEVLQRGNKDYTAVYSNGASKLSHALEQNLGEMALGGLPHLIQFGLEVGIVKTGTGGAITKGFNYLGKLALGTKVARNHSAVRHGIRTIVGGLGEGSVFLVADQAFEGITKYQGETDAAGSFRFGATFGAAGYLWKAINRSIPPSKIFSEFTAKLNKSSTFKSFQQGLGQATTAATMYEGALIMEEVYAGKLPSEIYEGLSMKHYGAEILKMWMFGGKQNLFGKQGLFRMGRQDMLNFQGKTFGSEKAANYFAKELGVKPSDFHTEYAGNRNKTGSEDKIKALHADMWMKIQKDLSNNKITKKEANKKLKELEVHITNLQGTQLWNFGREAFKLEKDSGKNPTDGQIYMALEKLKRFSGKELMDPSKFTLEDWNTLANTPEGILMARLGIEKKDSRFNQLLNLKESANGLIEYLDGTSGGGIYKTKYNSKERQLTFEHLMKQDSIRNQIDKIQNQIKDSALGEDVFLKEKLDGLKQELSSYVRGGWRFEKLTKTIKEGVEMDYFRALREAKARESKFNNDLLERLGRKRVTVTKENLDQIKEIFPNRNIKIGDKFNEIIEAKTPEEFQEMYDKTNLEAENVKNVLGFTDPETGNRYINKQKALDVRSTSTVFHEDIHFYLKDSFKNSEGKVTKEGIEIIDGVLNELTPLQRKAVQKRIDDNYRYDENGIEKKPEDYYEEYLSVLSEMMRNKKIIYKESLGKKISDFVPLLKKYLPNIKKEGTTEESRQLFDMLKGLVDSPTETAGVEKFLKDKYKIDIKSKAVFSKQEQALSKQERADKNFVESLLGHRVSIKDIREFTEKHPRGGKIPGIPTADWLSMPLKETRKKGTTTYTLVDGVPTRVPEVQTPAKFSKERTLEEQAQDAKIKDLLIQYKKGAKSPENIKEIERLEGIKKTLESKGKKISPELQKEIDALKNLEVDASVLKELKAETLPLLKKFQNMFRPELGGDVVNAKVAIENTLEKLYDTYKPIIDGKPNPVEFIGYATPIMRRRMAAIFEKYGFKEVPKDLLPEEGKPKEQVITGKIDPVDLVRDPDINIVNEIQSNLPASLEGKSFANLGNLAINSTAKLFGIPKAKLLDPAKNLTTSEARNIQDAIVRLGSRDILKLMPEQNVVPLTAREGIKGTSLIIPKSLLKSPLYNSTGVRSKGKKSQTEVFELNKNLTDIQFLKALGIIKGKDNITNDRTINQRLKGITNFYGRLMTNTTVRKLKYEDSEHVNILNDIALGKSKAMFSKDNNIIKDGLESAEQIRKDFNITHEEFLKIRDLVGTDGGYRMLEVKNPELADAMFQFVRETTQRGFYGTKAESLRYAQKFKRERRKDRDDDGVYVFDKESATKAFNKPVEKLTKEELELAEKELSKIEALKDSFLESGKIRDTKEVERFEKNHNDFQKFVKKGGLLNIFSKAGLTKQHVQHIFGMAARSTGLGKNWELKLDVNSDINKLWPDKKAKTVWTKELKTEIKSLMKKFGKNKNFSDKTKELWKNQIIDESLKPSNIASEAVTRNLIMEAKVGRKYLGPTLEVKLDALRKQLHPKTVENLGNLLKFWKSVEADWLQSKAGNPKEYFEAAEFLYRMGRFNSGLVKGQRAMFGNKYFYLSKEYQGMSRENPIYELAYQEAKERAEKDPDATYKAKDKEGKPKYKNKEAFLHDQARKAARLKGEHINDSSTFQVKSWMNNVTGKSEAYIDNLNIQELIQLVGSKYHWDIMDNALGQNATGGLLRTLGDPRIAALLKDIFDPHGGKDGKGSTLQEDVMVKALREIKKNPELAGHILNAEYLPNEGNKGTLESKKNNPKRTIKIYRDIKKLGDAAGVNTKDVTTSQIFDKINNLDKARTGLFSKDRGMTALDFDDTVAKTKSKVIVNLPQRLEGLGRIDKMEAEFWNKQTEISLEKEMGLHDWYKQDYEYHTILAKKKKIEDLLDLELSELRTKLKTAKGENKENIELAIQEHFKTFATAMDLQYNPLVKDAGINIYTGKPGGLPSTKLTPSQFARAHAKLEERGATFDFSEFTKVIGGKKGPLFDKLEKAVNKFGNENVFILTARPQASAEAIHAFLKGMGVNLKLENIVGLENGTPKAKADWIVDKIANGKYNDIYFADDAPQNVKAVQEVIEKLNLKGRSVEARFSKEKDLNKEINAMIEYSKGIGKDLTYTATKGRLAGKDKKGTGVYLPSRAEDFAGLVRPFLGKGKKGLENEKWWDDNFTREYSTANKAFLIDQRTRMNDYKALRRDLSDNFAIERNQNPKIQRKKFWDHPLKEKVSNDKNEVFTNEHAVRVYNWAKQGVTAKELNMSKKDFNRLVSHVKNNKNLASFADQLVAINKGDGYPKPPVFWEATGINHDMRISANNIKREKYFEKFNNNASIVFSEQNLNKMEAALGNPWRRAMENMLFRMRTGSNRPSWARGENWESAALDWLNLSVNDVMFLNTRSAMLQQVSIGNYVNYSDNNIFKASKAFANQPQFWRDYVKLMNSDWALNRREGLKFNIQESEIVDAAAKSKSKPIAFLQLALSKGFVLTKYADSHATAFGGASFYRNRINTYKKQINPQTGKKYTIKEAEDKALKDWEEISDVNQQSARADKISGEQASLLGRFTLNFNNVTLQYGRLMKKDVVDLANGRYDGLVKGNNSVLAKLNRILYYGAMQNAIFYGLQNAMFITLFDDDIGESLMDTKQERVINGMLDNILIGGGVVGKVLATAKNFGFKLYKESGKDRPEYEEAAWELVKVSPPADIKLRKFRKALRVLEYDMDEIKEKGFSLDNPALSSTAKFIEATTNAPTDRILMKSLNIESALEADREAWQRIFLFSGYNDYELAIEDEKSDYNPQLRMRTLKTRKLKSRKLK